MSIDDLIRRIDDELLILSEAPNVDRYSWFDFKTALRKLNDKLQNEGYNEYRKRKASEYINVFNDLCQTIVESVSYRTLAYDPQTGVKKIETYTHNSIAHTMKRGDNAYEVMPGLRAYCESLQLPEQHSEHLSETVKIDYLLRKCQVDYSTLEKLFDIDPEIEPVIAQMGFYSHVLSRKDEFERYFDVDINYHNKHRVSFEEYVKQIKAERVIEEGSLPAIYVPTPNNPATLPQVQPVPSELRTPEFEVILQNAIRQGLCTDTYEWRKGTQLAACFAQRTSDKLKLGKGVNSDGSPRISWQPFEKLFGFAPGLLRSNLNDIKKTGTWPSDISLLDSVL